MIRHLFPIMVLLVVAVLSGCKYRKGDMYKASSMGDSLNYVVLASGSGKKLSKKVLNLKLNHEYKGNVCQIKYISDSAMLNNQSGILLFNSAVPQFGNDILTKGFLGVFTSKQYVVYLLVSDQDFNNYFRKVKQ